MLFSRSVLVALISAPLLALAQKPNPFKVPTSGISATAGKATMLEWSPTTSGTVTLVVRTGTTNNLASGSPIASHIQNSGSFTWIPETSLAPGSDYAVEIIDDSDPSQTNFTPQFALSNPGYVATTSSTSASTSTASSSSTSSATTTSASSSSTSSSTQSTITTTTSSGTSSHTSSHSSTTTGSSSTSLAAQLSTNPTNGAPRATAMAGMLGMVALGALAL